MHRVKLLTLLMTYSFFLVGCSHLNSSEIERFDYKPVEFGFGDEGYAQKKLGDGVWEVKILGMKKYSQEALETLFYKRASEICGDKDKISIIVLGELVDICPEGGCFASAVGGRFKCSF